MRKQQKRIQIILISIGLLLIAITYFYYPYLKKVDLIKDRPFQKDSKNVTDDDQQSTFFENVEYKGLYDLDKEFTVKSETAHILSTEPDIVYMERMHVVLYLNDGRIVNITSDEGRYNKITYDCFFEKNVIANDGETQILAKNLDLLATDNIVKIYNDVDLYYPTGSLQADMIDYDFETKYFKVSMFDDKDIKMKLIIN